MTNLEKYLKRPLTETERTAIETLINLGKEATDIVHVIENCCVTRVSLWRRCPEGKTCYDCWMEEYKGDN